jgi:hypothetical protein
MSEPDKYDERARQIADHCRFCDRLNDNYKCTDDYAASVLAIAAALREQGAEIERLRNALKIIARGDSATGPMHSYQLRNIAAAAIDFETWRPSDER